MNDLLRARTLRHIRRCIDEAERSKTPAEIDAALARAIDYTHAARCAERGIPLQSSLSIHQATKE